MMYMKIKLILALIISGEYFLLSNFSTVITYYLGSKISSGGADIVTLFCFYWILSSSCSKPITTILRLILHLHRAHFPSASQNLLLGEDLLNLSIFWSRCSVLLDEFGGNVCSLGREAEK